MAIKDEEQIRGWSIDYALRLHPKDQVVTSRQVIAEAKQIERYITGSPPATVLRLAKDNNKK